MFFRKTSRVISDALDNMTRDNRAHMEYVDDYIITDYSRESAFYIVH